MNDVNELWSSPWRKLQKNLAGGFASPRAGQDLADFYGHTAAAAASSSWLVRAHSLMAKAPRIIQ